MADSFEGVGFGGVCAGEEIEADAATAAGVALLRRSFAFAGEDADVEAGHGLAVEAELAVGGGDEDVAEGVGVGCLYLNDAGFFQACGGIGAFDEEDAFFEGLIDGGVEDGV